jgi:hypothetical protein
MSVTDSRILPVCFTEAVMYRIRGQTNPVAARKIGTRLMYHVEVMMQRLLSASQLNRKWFLMLG